MVLRKMVDMFRADTEPCQEARVGAEWWANFLREPDSVTWDNGDPVQSAFASVVRDKHSAHQEPFDPDKVDEFEELVAEGIQGRIDQQTWDYDQPYMGNRHIRCDYHAHPILASAADEVGIEISSMTTFPAKTGMWVDPGHVQVSVGYQAGRETVWEIGDYLEDIREVVGDWDFDVRVFPTDDGYILRVYREIEDAKYGQKEHVELDVANGILNEAGVESTLSNVHTRAVEWRTQ